MVNKAKRSKPPKPGRNGVCNPGKISRIPFITLPDTVLERIFDNARVTFLRKNTQELAQIALGSPFKPGSIVNSAVSSVDGRLWRMPTIFLFLCRRCYAVAQQILLRHILLESEQAAGLFNTYINLNPHASAYISSLTLDGHDIPPSLIAPIIAKSSSVQQIQLWRLAKGVDSTAWSLSNLPPNHHSRPILQHLLIDCDPSSMLNGGSIRDLIAFLPPSSHLILVGFGIPFTMNARLASFPPFPSVRYLNITQSASNVTELADLIKGCSKHLESLEIKFPVCSFPVSTDTCGAHKKASTDHMFSRRCRSDHHCRSSQSPPSRIRKMDFKTPYRSSFVLAHVYTRQLHPKSIQTTRSEYRSSVPGTYVKEVYQVEESGPAGMFFHPTERIL